MMYNKLKGAVIRAVISIGMVGILLLTSCGTIGGKNGDAAEKNKAGNASNNTAATSTTAERNGDLIEASAMADQIRAKYEKSDLYDYTDPISDVARDEVFKKQIGFDIINGQFDKYNQIIAIYQDSEFTQEVNAHYEWNEETQELDVMPPLSEIGSVYAGDMDKDVAGNDGVSTTLYDKGESKDWGNLSEYYMVQYVDLQTGETLAKPLVTVFTVKHEILNAPSVKVTINEEGLPQFSWDEVKGAENYYVISISHSAEGGLQGGGSVLGSTSGTTWTPDAATNFITYLVSEEERSEDYNIEQYGEGTDPILQDMSDEDYFCVIAVSKEGTSAISNTVAGSELAHRIPYTEEVGKNLEEDSNYANSVLELPAYKWVTMCDGKLVQKLVNYDYENAKETTETWGVYEKEDMSDLHSEEVNIVKIPYTIDGTGFTGTGVVQDYNPDTLADDLQALKERQEGLQNKAGSQDLNIDVEEQEATQEDSSQVENSGDVYTTNYGITANSALSEYLARMMMTGAEVIDLTPFPESSDQAYLMDAWQEAVYQNPLILGVSNAWISRGGRYLMVEYDTDIETTLKKQEELITEVQKVIGKIITDGMSDLDKENAINQYLCDSAEYDMAALENAEDNDFESVDEEFNDSFTPYGVLINKVGVCSSYAGAFKLLADAAGLECIAVTGYLDGETPHEWNKVKIDGEWQIVDSTNNDNEELFNALFNLPDSAADKVLVEDDAYVLDTNLDDYAASTTEKEYYRINNKYFTEDVIANSIAAEINASGRSVLRTDYNLNDDEFAAIGQQVINQTGDEDLVGYYWMGVIYIERETSE